MTAEPIDSYVVSYPSAKTGRIRKRLIENQSDFSKLPPLKADQNAPAMPKQDAAGFLTTSQAAQFLSFSAKTLANWRVSGEGPDFHRLGSAVRYLQRDLIAWAEGENAQTPARRTVPRKKGCERTRSGCDNFRAGQSQDWF